MSKPSVTRFMQFERLLMICELLAPLRHGATMKEILDDVCDFTGQQYSERTIHRDLKFLEMKGIIDSTKPVCGKRKYRWRCCIRSIVVEHMATVANEYRESSTSSSAC